MRPVAACARLPRKGAVRHARDQHAPVAAHAHRLGVVGRYSPSQTGASRPRRPPHRTSAQTRPGRLRSIAPEGCHACTPATSTLPSLPTLTDRRRRCLRSQTGASRPRRPPHRTSAQTRPAACADCPGRAPCVKPATSTLPSLPTLTDKGMSWPALPNWRVQTSAPAASYFRTNASWPPALDCPGRCRRVARDQHAAVAAHAHRIGVVVARGPKLARPDLGARRIVLPHKRVPAACARLPRKGAGRVARDQHAAVAAHAHRIGVVAARGPKLARPELVARRVVLPHKRVLTACARLPRKGAVRVPRDQHAAVAAHAHRMASCCSRSQTGASRATLPAASYFRTNASPPPALDCPGRVPCRVARDQHTAVAAHAHRHARS
jgi:hypothetical protein